MNENSNVIENTIENLNVNETTVETLGGSNKNFAIAVGVGAAALLGGLIYKKVVKPYMTKKAEAKDEANKVKVVEVDFEEDEEEIGDEE